MVQSVGSKKDRGCRVPLVLVRRLLEWVVEVEVVIVTTRLKLSLHYHRFRVYSHYNFRGHLQ